MIRVMTIRSRPVTGLGVFAGLSASVQFGAGLCACGDSVPETVQFFTQRFNFAQVLGQIVFDFFFRFACRLRLKKILSHSVFDPGDQIANARADRFPFV